MALTADRKLEYREGVDLALPVEESTEIFAGDFVCVNAAGYCVPGADTAALIFMGMSREHADNSDGDDGDATVLLRRRGLVKAEFATAITIANVGDNVFLAGDGQVDVAGNVDNDIFCGIIAEYIDTTHAWIDIEPAIRQADVATHVADASGAHAATAISIADAGAHFSAAEADVEKAIQKLAKTIVIAIPRFTGWTKDGDDKAIALPALELPVPVRVKRAYVALGTAPGADKTLALKLNTSALVSIAGTDVAGAAESLDIAIAKDTALALTAGETADGTAANCDVMLVCQVDDGE